VRERREREREIAETHLPEKEKKRPCNNLP